MMTLDTHCYDDFRYTLLVLIYIIKPHVPWIHIVMYPVYILLWWTWIYIAGTYLYYYTSCTLDKHCYLPCIHFISMNLNIHCWYLSISLYLMYPGHTLFWWPWIYIAGTYLYHSNLYTLDTHCYDDPGYTLLVFIYIIPPYIPWIHIVMMTLDTHCNGDPGYTLLVLIYIILPYILLIHIVMMTLDIHCCYLSISNSLCTLDTHCYND